MTFGSPRVGNRDFSIWMNDYLREVAGIKNYRFVFAKDPVPHVPMSSMGYVHVGNEIYLQEGIENIYDNDKVLDCLESNKKK